MNWLYIVLAVVITALVVFAMFSNKVVKYVVITIVCLGLGVGGFYCGSQLVTYYNTEGGVFGFLDGLYDSNKLEVVDDLTFNLKNTEFQRIDNSHYSLEIKQDVVMNVSQDKFYNIFVNNQPCYNSVQSFSTEKYISAEYQYNFYNADRYLKDNDTLTINIAFYKNYTRLLIETNGGEDAVKLWNQYFNKNNFVISLKENAYQKGKDLNFGEGEIPEICIVKFMVKEDEYKRVVVLKGENVAAVDNPVVGEEAFIGWTLNGEDVVDYTNLKIEQDTTFIAKFESYNAGLFDLDTNTRVSTWDELMGAGYFTVADGKLDKTDKTSTLQGKLIIPDGIKTIGFVFYQSQLTEIVLPKSLTEISSMAFQGCVNLKEITIPENVVTIGNMAFASNPNLKINVDENNKAFRVKYGALLQEDKILYGATEAATKLQQLADEEGITQIGNDAFYENITQQIAVVVPKNITVVWGGAFDGCAITRIDFLGCASISAYAFSRCENLKYVFIGKVESSFVGKNIASGSNDSLKFYCEDSAKPTGWNSDWNGKGGGGHNLTYFSTTWKVSYSSYLSKIGA